MVDVTLILPPSQVTTVAAGGQQTQSATEAGAQPPGMPPGTLVSGTIAGRDTAGNFLLKSALGTLTLHSSVPLTYNSDVVIRLGANLAGNANARIISVNGQPYAEFSTPEPEENDSVSRSLLTQQQPVTANTANNTKLLSAVVVSSPPAAQSGTTVLQQGANVVVRLPDSASAQTQQSETLPPATPQAAPTTPSQTPTQAGNTTPAAAPAPATSAATPQTQIPLAASPATANTPQTVAAPVSVTSNPTQAAQTNTAVIATPSAGQEAPATTPQQVPTAPVAAQYSVYAKQTLPPAPQQAGAPAPAAAAATISGSIAQPSSAAVTAQVVSADSSGLLTVDTPLGAVTLKTAALPAQNLLAPGTNVTLELPQLPSQALAAAATPASLSEMAASWQSLKDIIAAATASDPVAGAQLLSRMPQLGENFVASSFSFIRNLLSGDAKKLLGQDTVDTLRQNGKQGLLERFSGELQSVADTFTPAQQKQQGGWQAMVLPFVYQEVVEQARLYVKREAPKKDRSAKSTADTRFVVEVDLSDIGALQMDGLVRKKDSNTAFDLVIRSHHAFDPEDQTQILSIYNEAAEITGFKGSLSFQVTRDFPVKPLEDAAGSGDHGFSV